MFSLALAFYNLMTTYKSHRAKSINNCRNSIIEYETELQNQSHSKFFKAHTMEKKQ